jgi:hypothetical protein
MSHASLVEIYIATKTASSSMGALAPAELRAEAEQAVDKAVAQIEAMRQNGDFKQLNARYKQYRRAQMARREPAIPYSVFLERRVATIVRLAATGG